MGGGVQGLWDQGHWSHCQYKMTKGASWAPFENVKLFLLLSFQFFAVLDIPRDK